ncbi:BA75_01818T0 [Komagataella pastoris]|uniref:BA75_01818T0 n=1 Tax=Komagataella pastoris TaxID=4922 RepID=A0A1B2J8P9_PICPA|nr:BA75_01818T0 [Komagataella pastoris]
MTTRQPLKETNNNVCKTPAKETRKLSTEKATTQHSQNVYVQNTNVSSSMRQWQQCWREILKSTVVYFEYDAHEDSAERKKAKQHLERLGCTIDMFFNDGVTIIVSKRPFNSKGVYPANDLFHKAIRRNLKVWSYEKVFRFLRNLGELPSADVGNEKVVGTEENRLSSLLKEEKLLGPTDRDPSAKRDDFHYFKAVYFLVYDFQLKYRPIAFREWSKPDDPDIPHIRASTNGGCPFESDYARPNSERMIKKRRMLYERNKEYRLRLYEASNLKKNFEPPTSVMNPSPQPDDDNKAEDQETNSILSLNEENENQTQPIVTPLPPQSNKPSAEAPILKRNDTVLLELMNKSHHVIKDNGEIQASGITNISTQQVSQNSAVHQNRGNGLGPIKAEVYNKKVSTDKRKTVTLQRNFQHEESLQQSAKLAQDLAPPQLPVKKDRKRKRERAAYDGYCENCRIEYDNLSTHIKTQIHRSFARDDCNFKNIDNLIFKLAESRSLQV